MRAPYPSILLVLAAIRLGLAASPGEPAFPLVRSGGFIGTRIPDTVGRILDPGFRDRKLKGRIDSLWVRSCADSLDIRLDSPDTGESRESTTDLTIHGPFRFGRLSNFHGAVSNADMAGGFDLFPPWIAVAGRDGSGFARLSDLVLCRDPSIAGFLGRPAVLRKPYVAMLDSISRRGPAPMRLVVVGADGRGHKGDSLARTSDARPDWMVVSPGKSRAETGYVIGFGNEVDFVLPGFARKSIRFEDGYQRFALRVDPLGSRGVVVELRARYGDGYWIELARVVGDEIRIEAIGGSSGGEGREYTPAEELEAVKDEPGPWWIDQTTGEVWTKQKFRKVRKVF